MKPYSLLIVGPESRVTGGIAHYVNEQRDRLPDEIDREVYDIGTPAGTGIWIAIATLLVSVQKMLAFPFRSKPDVAHVHTSDGFAFLRASFYVLFAAYVWRCPVVVHVHGSSFDEFVDANSLAVQALLNRVFAASEAVIVLSEYWKEALGSLVPEEKLVVLPNAVDTSGYEPSYERDRAHVVFVSNHVRRKGIVEFVEAIDRLKSSAELPFDVSIAGSGQLATHAEELAAAYPTVTYHGYVSEREKRALLDRGSIYVLPAYAEGLPIALLEGMAAGNAIISTAVGSIPEVIGDENGILVDARDVDQLQAALTKLISDPERTESMGRANHRLAAEQYSWSTTVERLAELYQTLISVDEAESRTRTRAATPVDR